MQSLLDSLDGVGKFCYVEVSVFRGPWSSHGYSINAPINIETQLIVVCGSILLPQFSMK